MIRALVLSVIALALVASDVVSTSEPERDPARDAELAELVAWMQSEGGWFTVRHPDPVAAARTEPLERIRNDLARVMRATEPLLPARKAILLATLQDPSLHESVRAALARFLSTFHAMVDLDRDERLRAEGVLHRLTAYDYSRAINLLTLTVLREFRGQSVETVAAALAAAGWTTDADDIRYVIETVIPSVRVD